MKVYAVIRVEIDDGDLKDNHCFPKALNHSSQKNEKIYFRGLLL